MTDPYLANGTVTLHCWPGSGRQASAYQHCLARHGHEAKWIAFLDDDEFLFPARGQNLRERLSAYESYAGVAACWLLFGSNGHRIRPPGLVTRNYSRRGNWVDQHVKCVVDPAKVTGPAVLGHSFHCRPGEMIVDENHARMLNPCATHPSADVFCLNHYLTKSHEEMVARRTRNQASGTTSDHSIAVWEQFDSQYNTVEDLRIQRFAAALERDAG